MTSWIDKREVQSEKANLTILFDRYVPPCLDSLRHRFKKITPVSEQSMIQTLCYLLEALLTPANTPPDCPKEWYELYFVFAAVWAFGGSMYEDQVCIRGREGGREREGEKGKEGEGGEVDRLSGCKSVQLLLNLLLVPTLGSWWTIVWSSQSGGPMSSRTSSFPRKAQSLTTTLSQGPRSGFRGLR